MNITLITTINHTCNNTYIDLHHLPRDFIVLDNYQPYTMPTQNSHMHAHILLLSHTQNFTITLHWSTSSTIS